MEVTELKEGMIGLSGGDEWIQKKIRYFTGSDFSHSFMMLKNSQNVLCALETTATKVVFNPVYEKMTEKNWIEIWDVIAPEEDKKKALNECLVYIGKWYGYLSYLWFMYRFECRKFGYEPDKMWFWCTYGQTCTELTSKYPRKLFPDIYKGIDPNTIAPPEQRKIMLANPDRFVLKGWLIERQ